MLRLISWNVHARVRASQDAQAHVILEAEPDIVALQEVTVGNRDSWRHAFETAGLAWVVTSNDLAPDSTVLTGRRKFGVLFASRWPLEPMSPHAHSLPWPERLLTAVANTPFGPIEMHTTHVPVGANDGEATAKVSTLEGLYGLLARSVDGHRLLCGDLNAPCVEYPDGRVLSWAQNVPSGTVKKGRERWDAAERGVLLGLADYDLTDAYRKVHGYAEPAESWAAINRGRRFPRRLDHLLTSASLGVRDIRYRNDWQYDNLSDHAAIEAVFEPAMTCQPSAMADRTLDASPRLE